MIFKCRFLRSVPLKVTLDERGSGLGELLFYLNLCVFVYAISSFLLLNTPRIKMEPRNVDKNRYELDVIISAFWDA